MSFSKSFMNQLGRDTAKVVSNSLYGDAHATPIRRVVPNMYNNFISTYEISQEELRNQVIDEGYKYTLRKTHPAFIIIAIVASYFLLFIIGIIFIIRGIIRIHNRKYSIYEKIVSEAIMIPDRRYKVGYRVDGYRNVLRKIKVIASQYERANNSFRGIIYIIIGIIILFINMYEFSAIQHYFS